ncbi:hypothetical protein ACFSC3_14210 [Sphingomonas floccifaciens]|uniref:STAS/SEC14 domain-containing protein n=1 Tax=Sphingomonas floccifaciens TaxID=1844115 RepID=A0ABW4NF97_9SPHN
MTEIHGDRSAGDGDFTAVLADDGVFDITIRGFWTTEQVDRFFVAILPMHHDCRERFRRVCAQIRIESVQSPSVALHVRDRALALKRPGDRNAFVFASFLSKLQITRLASNDDFGLFTDEATARAWLLA